jgi:hypothetical protein
VTKMRFMYDRACDNINYGHTSGLTPYYKMVSLLFRYTLTLRGGDSDNISHIARNLLYQMAPGQPQFNACHFLWNEIIICSYNSYSGCHYANYIFLLVKHATNLILRLTPFMRSIRLVKASSSRSSDLVSIRHVLILRELIWACILLRDTVMPVPQPIKLNLHGALMILFQWRCISLSWGS